jgi:hypothetical protein
LARQSAAAEMRLSLNYQKRRIRHFSDVAARADDVVSVG